jgi:hypothetical protein
VVLLPRYDLAEVLHTHLVVPVNTYIQTHKQL